MKILFHNDAYYDIENVLGKNWNRVLKRKTLSRIFELCRIWWRRIDEALMYIANATAHTHTGGGVHIYEISDNIGTIEYYLLMEKGAVVAIVIESFSLNLPWRKGEVPQILTANNALIEVSNIKTHRMRIYENENSNKMRLKESQLRSIIRKTIRRIMLTR